MNLSSVDLSAFPDSRYATLLQLADEALYEAKESGRNCVRRSAREYAEMETGRFVRRSHLRVVR